MNMQSLDVISVNLWNILISLCNLFLLFLAFKKFLFGPVKKALAKRENAIAEQYSAAEDAKRAAEEDRMLWEEKMRDADAEADSIIKQATATADRRSENILADAKVQADGIVRQAKADAELEQRKAQAGIRQELAGLSSALTGKLLSREINPEDHRELIDEFLNELGDAS